MAITQQHKDDVYEALDFADNLRAATGQIRLMRQKIARYGDGVAAVQDGTADARETRFVQLVTLLIGADDVQRIATLVPLLEQWLTTIDTEFADFLTS